jgi:tRNA/tmRNA/rRNA uracil-C5-methylase (TrmA/RlmC/RlmD family)
MVALSCPHQPLCPGCPRLAQPGLPPDALSRVRALASAAGAPAPELHPSAPTGFRYRARLAVRGRADAPKLGIFEAGSHRAVHIPRCLVHHPALNAVAAKLREELALQRVPTYSDNAHAGIVRYAQLVLERETERVQVTLVCNATSPEAILPVLEGLERKLGRDLHGAWWNPNTERTNTILGSEFHHLLGERHVRDRSGQATLFYPPGAFGQSNLVLASELAANVRAMVGDGERVSELYAGVGAIGLGLAERAAALNLNELGSGSLEGLQLGVDALPEPQRAKVNVHAGSAAAFTDLIAQSDFVIADPPRKGLDAAVTQQLMATPPRRFAYVSCDVGSLERDAAVLLERFTLSSLAAYDLFPHTEHLETLALFERR